MVRANKNLFLFTGVDFDKIRTKNYITYFIEINSSGN